MPTPPQKSSTTTLEKRVHIPYQSASGNLPFSSAVIVGNTAYICGHLGLEPGTRNVPAEVEDEVHAMMSSLRETLTRASLTMNDLVTVQVFCSDISLFERFNKIYATYFKYPLPARAFIGSGPLLYGAHFEIQGIAVRAIDA